MEFTIRAMERKDTGNGVVRGISLNHDRGVRNPMGKDRCGGESGLEGVESVTTVIGEVPGGTLAGQVGEQNDKIGIIIYKAAVKVSKPKEGLDVLYFAGFRPVEDSLYFIASHGKTLQR